MSDQNAITQHIPDFVETRAAPLSAEFVSLEELQTVPFVARWIAEEGFHRLSVSDGHLMAEYRGGREWWVLGYLRHDVPELPRWDGGIYEVHDEGGDFEVQGNAVKMCRGNEVYLRDGRVVQRRGQG